MARHTAKSHKIRKVEILVIQIEIFLFFETTSLYLVYWQIIGYARCRFQKHNFFYFLKVETAKEEAIEATGTNS